MRRPGIDVTGDQVYPDLVFGLPVPPYGPGDPETVGVGVMAYYGTNDDRGQADELHGAYIETMKDFVRWLVDSGYRVRLFWGDNARTKRRRGDPGRPARIPARPRAEWAVAEPVLAGRADARDGAGWHFRRHPLSQRDVRAQLGKPTLSIGYARKHDPLMADMGLSEFCQSAPTL